MQNRSLTTNAGARTSDWLGQTKGRAIYAYDLGALIESAGERPSRDANKAAYRLVQQVIAKDEKRDREPVKKAEKTKRT